MNRELSITYPLGQETARQMATFFNAEIDNNYGEERIQFDNEYGNGLIRVLPFGDGLCLISFDVNFLYDIDFIIEYADVVPVDFLFLTSGKLRFKLVDSKSSYIERYQNVIVRYKLNESVIYTMECGEVTQLNLIQIQPKPYLEKNSHYLELQEMNIKEMFYSDDSTKFYRHLGNFNLHIADFIRQMNHCSYQGMVRSLMMEGLVNMVLALQLAEYESFIENSKLPESLTKEDIIKIQKAAEIIHDKINQNIAVSKLASMVNLSQPKLQFGFKYLYQKTVNNYTKEIKLQKAHSYFLNTDLNISEVVYRVGYSSRSYFTEIFFERYGILPNQFKRKTNN